MRAKKNKPTSISFGDFEVFPGESKRIELPISKLLTQNLISIPVHVVYGEKPGPTLCLSSTLHGDEICGVEIIRQVLPEIHPAGLHGILIYVPIVNVFGFMNNSRYLPDRRDLNRCFPGSDRGSMASRLAYLYTEEIIKKCTYAIDFHTASAGKINYPQVRANLDDPKTLAFAKSFQAPVMIHAKNITGSLRETATKNNCQMIVFEGGEVNRFNPYAVEVGVDGTFHVLKSLKMIQTTKEIQTRRTEKFVSAKWVRASKSGLFQFLEKLGSRVKRGERIGVISNIFGDVISHVTAPNDGMIIGMSTNPKVYQGDAIIHLARK